MRKPRAIALYLPQYHPIPENDRWWGRGFTEWTNTAKAKPLYHGHYQPHVPTELGFYDLRVPESREDQAALAREYGIEGFCYYHYWFAGRRILERPFNEVLASAKPDFPFCLCWANETWSGVWHGNPKRVLIHQTYPGPDDHAAHFASLLAAFRDRRYILVDGKPLFIVYRPLEIPDVRSVTAQWREMATRAGLPGLHLVGFEVDHHPNWVPQDDGFDASVRSRPPRKNTWIGWDRPLERLKQYVDQRLLELTGRATGGSYAPTVHDYRRVWESMVPPRSPGVESYPCVIPNWDNTPRSGRGGMVLEGATPELFRLQLRRAFEVMQGVNPEHNIVILKSWNEWAEGNHLEPDLRFGRAFLEVVREELAELGSRGAGTEPTPHPPSVSLAGAALEGDPR